MSYRFPIWYFFECHSEYRCIFAYCVSSNPSNSFLMLFIHSNFLLCWLGSLHSHILLQNCFVSLSSIGWYEVHKISFQTFFVWALLLIVHETLVSFEVFSSDCNALVVPFQQLMEGPMDALLCERVNDPRHSLFHLLNCLITTASELRE